MSYRCDNCDDSRPCNEQPTKVVVHIRTYDNSTEWQIGKEVNACPNCAEVLMSKGPRESRIAKGPGYTPYTPLPEFEGNEVQDR